MQNLSDFLPSIITIILAVLLLVFLKKKEMSAKIKINKDMVSRYRYELIFYVSLDMSEEAERFTCGSNLRYGNPLTILKELNLIQKGFLVLPKEQETVLIKMNDIRKITMLIRENEITVMKGWMCVPKSGTQSKKDSYVKEDKE